MYLQIKHALWIWYEVPVSISALCQMNSSCTADWNSSVKHLMVKSTTREIFNSLFSAGLCHGRCVCTSVLWRRESICVANGTLQKRGPLLKRVCLAWRSHPSEDTTKSCDYDQHMSFLVSKRDLDLWDSTGTNSRARWRAWLLPQQSYYLPWQWWWCWVLG